MPVILTIGERDPLIPVAEARKIAAAMKGRSNFIYYEIPQGGHDAALWVDIDLDTLRILDPRRPPG
jgi:pimeloyl-ACP methyl ester carboxylesterase